MFRRRSSSSPEIASSSPDSAFVLLYMAATCSTLPERALGQLSGERGFDSGRERSFLGCKVKFVCGLFVCLLGLHGETNTRLFCAHRNVKRLWRMCFEETSTYRGRIDSVSGKSMKRKRFTSKRTETKSTMKTTSLFYG